MDNDGLARDEQSVRDSFASFMNSETNFMSASDSKKALYHQVEEAGKSAGEPVSDISEKVVSDGRANEKGKIFCEEYLFGKKERGNGIKEKVYQKNGREIDDDFIR
jgi:hypothetical protein